MKTRILTFILLSLLMIFGTNLSAEKRTFGGESYGGTFNAGLGVGYNGYYRSLPVFHLNYEFDVAKNFTLAPFVTFYSNPNVYDHYRATIIPIGVKGTYYLDQALNANSNWDFYVAGSLGFTYVRWEERYVRPDIYYGPNPLFLDLHLGAEYHLSNHVGLFLDLSTGVSTVGLSFR